MSKPLVPPMPLYISLLIIVVAAMFVLRRCGSFAANSSDGADSLDVCIEYSPMSCYMYADTVGGFGYDVLRLVAKRGGINLRMHNVVSLHTGLEGLDNGNYKLMVAQFPATAEVKQRYLFTDAVYLDRQVLVQRIDSLGNITVKSQLDLAQDTIYVVQNSPMYDRIRALSHEIGDPIFITEGPDYNAEQLMIMVATGQIDYAVVNAYVAKNLVGAYPNLNIGTKISFTQFQSWALPLAETAIRDSINAWLADVKAGEAYADLCRRYGVTEH